MIITASRRAWALPSSYYGSLVICILLTKFLTEEKTLLCWNCEARVDQLPLPVNLPLGFQPCAIAPQFCFCNSLSSLGPGMILGCPCEGGCCRGTAPRGWLRATACCLAEFGWHSPGLSHRLWRVLPVNLKLPLSHQDLTPVGTHRGLVLKSRAEDFGQHLLYSPSSAKPNSEFPHTSLSLFCFPKPKS